MQHKDIKPIYISIIVSLIGLLVIAAAPEEKRKGAGQGGQVESAVVPPYLFNVWLCRSGADSVTASVLAWVDGIINQEVPQPSHSSGGIIVIQSSQDKLAVA